ncbi:DJ-1/PfpI family protein [Brevundimonas sp.]|uniref:DJ-1/PfpI family protein n=1 Tax=Brevundimonas sp. TaxID=1871086 RepID=UPI002D4AA226|nr:DJ-1/PfpI family protein [Brevundimonas sp.]HYD26242.1 DJ-1/PfpI family protein [Brevundimonas sp.]
MRRRIILWGGLGAVVLAAAIGAGLILSLPPAPAAASPAPVPAGEAAAALAALKPPKRDRPVIAIIGINDATETTDYLMPYGILKRADVAEVVLLATEPGPVKLYPALTVEADSTTAAFDAAHPQGADYVIVPAMSRDDDPAALAWIRKQAAGGATIIGVCAGAVVVGETGLLDGRRATTHWYFLKRLRKGRPEVRYAPDRRLVVDGRVATTTGISASMPMALTLIEAIAGRGKAEAVARELGLASWDARHDSGAFRLNRPFALTVMGNKLAFWNRETLGLALTPGMDEVSLALVADAWSRTYRSRAATFAEGPVTTRSGVRILPDEATTDWPEARRLEDVGARRPAGALDTTLAEIESRYGRRTADVVAMQLEYSRRAGPAEPAAAAGVGEAWPSIRPTPTPQTSIPANRG